MKRAAAIVLLGLTVLFLIAFAHSGPTFHGYDNAGHPHVIEAAP